MKNNTVGFEELMKYEDGQMAEEELVSLFQKLVDTGMAWQLQGHYGRTAQTLIEMGLIELKKARKS
jgi:hypothetical protein